MKKVFHLFILLILSQLLPGQSGDREINVTDKAGRKQGVWKKHYSGDTVIRYKGQFRNDQPYGEFLYYYRTGELQTRMKFTDSNRSNAVSFYPDGQVMMAGVYSGQLRDSTWRYYNDNGVKVSEEYYIMGKKYGNWKVYFPSGRIMQEKYYENDLENGPFRQYFENGLIYREGIYKDGSLEGDAAFYYPNGQLRFEGSYYHDVKDGIWKTYDKSGKLMDERMYFKGVPEYRESDLIEEDTSAYYRKDRYEVSDIVSEEYQAFPDKNEEKESKKKQKNKE